MVFRPLAQLIDVLDSGKRQQRLISDPNGFATTTDALRYHLRAQTSAS